MLSPGALIGGRYRLLKLLGQGGMGVVWHAKNEAIDREVALKLMAPGLAQSEDALRRFFNEARICGSIRHPGIVDVLDLGRTPTGEPFIVMELLDGIALDRLIEEQRQLPATLACRIVRDVATTVQLAHDKGVVHRDLKPANVFLHRGPEGRIVVKVLDFGVSKVIGGDSISATRTGSMMGTPSYMSPEQAGGRLTVDHRADIHALGTMLYEALSGRLPYEAPTAQALVVDIATSQPIPIRERMAHLPEPLAELVTRCIERDRERRVQTARELAARLEEISASSGAAPPIEEMVALSVSSRRGEARDVGMDPTALVPTPAMQKVDSFASTTPRARPLVEGTLPSVGHHSEARFARRLPLSEGAAAASSNPKEVTVSPVSSTGRRARPSSAKSLLIAGALIGLVGFGALAIWTTRTRTGDDRASAVATTDATAAELTAAQAVPDPTAPPPVPPEPAAPLPSATSSERAPSAVVPTASASAARKPAGGGKPPTGRAPSPAASAAKPSPARGEDGMWGYD